MALSVEAATAKFLSGDDGDSHVVVGAVCAADDGLFQLIQALGPGITSDQNEARVRAMELLSVVLQLVSLRGKQLTATDVGLIAKFFSERIVDSSCLRAVINGLIALAVSPHFSAHVVDVLTIIFKEVHVQSLPQLTRQKIFEFNTLIFHKHIDAVKTMQDGFADTIIKQMDGEKDPRCLVLVFRFIPEVIKHFSVDHCLEDLFDVTSCYFPITFTPPPDDPIGISQKELIDALQLCMGSTPKFAPLLMSLIFHKMGSGIDVAKTQSYSMIESCADSYGPGGLRPALSQIYTSVRTELFQSFDEEIKGTALRCLTKAVSVVYAPGAEDSAGAKDSAGAEAGEAGGEGTKEGGACQSEACCGGGCGEGSKMDTESAPGKDFLDDLLAESVRHLRDFDVGLIKLHGRLLGACSQGSEVACSKICQSMLPAIEKEMGQDPSKDHKIAYFGVIQAQVDAALVVGSSNMSCISAEQHAWLNTVYTACLADADADVRSLGLQGLSKIMDYNIIVDLQGLCTSFVDKCLQDPEEVVVAAANKALGSLARQHPDSIYDHALPALNAALAAAGGDEAAAKQTLAVFAGISTSWKLNVSILATLLQYIAQLDARHPAPTDAALQLAVVVGGALQQLLHSTAELFPAEGLFAAFVSPCLRQWLAALVAGSGSLLWHPSVQALISGGLRQCCQAMPVDQQQEMLRVSMSIFRDGVTKDVGLDLPKLEFMEDGRPEARGVKLLPALLCSFKKEVTSELDGLLPFIDSLVACASARTDAEEARAVSITAAALLNKTPQAALTGHLGSLLSLLDGQLQATSDVKSRGRHVQIWAWMVKALILRAHPEASKFSAVLMKFLGDEDIGKDAAESFKIVLGDCDEALNSKASANVRMMYKQRYFVENLPALIQGLHSADAALKMHYLIAMSHLLSSVSKQVLLSQIAAVFPVVVQSLKYTEPELVNQTLKIVTILITDATDHLVGHVDTIIPLLIQLTRNPKLQVRCASLDCLASVGNLPEMKIYRQVPNVLRELAPVLDDHKRIVRAAAVKCSNRWHLIGNSKK